MSGVSSSKRILRTTVAAAAASAVVLSPLAPLAEEMGAAVDPIDIRVGANPRFTRVEFAGVIGARSQVRREGQTVIVRIGATAAPDISRLRVDPPKGVESVETRSVPGATELVLTLAEGADARTGSADGAVWLNLYAPGKAPPAEAGAQTAAAAAIPVTATATADKVSLNFAWTQPVGAAVFRRGAAVWVVFDTVARLDMAGARTLGPATDARWAAGADYTAVRIAAPEGLPVSVVSAGSSWTVVIGGQPVATTGVEVTRADSGDLALVVRMAGATRAVWLTDPLVGDRFAAVTALAPGKGLSQRRQSVDLTLLPTAHGLAIETPTDDLRVAADGDLVSLTRPGGLILSPPSVLLAAAEVSTGAPQKARFAALILPEWSDTGPGGFGPRMRELQDRAAEEAQAAGDNPRAPIEARLALARFLVASGLGYEAIGILNAIIDQAPNMAGEAEVRGLRGAARTSIGRIEEAQADFAAGALAGDPSARVWQGYIAAQQGDWAEARRGFIAGASVIDSFPEAWRARFGAAHALAALETGDLDATKSLLAYSFSQPASAADQLTARLVQARLFELQGEGDRALAVYKAVARAPLDGISTPAKLAVVRMELARGTLKPDAAADQLESLRWRWRGDATELAVIRQLGSLYLSQGLYREALTALRGAGTRMADLPGATDLQMDLSNAFRSLFLEGGADGLQPIQALGLFYDFRELTPVGADGDEMVRRLARRLVNVDLLDQAAELLKHQVDNRLEGVAKAQVATDLATVYLMDRQAEKALQAIWSSRTTLLPNTLNAERRALEARALMDLGRFDHALEVLDRDATPAAQAVRAEVFWKQENWAAAAAAYDKSLGERWKDSTVPLTPGEESLLIRAGVGYSLVDDQGALARLSRDYAPLVPGARSAGALRIALAGPNGGDVDPADIGTAAGGADTFSGWVTAMKAQFRQQTGGTRTAATPARPQTQAPAPAAAARPAAAA
ncbi:MAG: tetratricopeptide (TPR) repeat protein [Brevundimonas sp.]|jgi:tetratricopeptide (TPR) repeat protein|uniref:tetratricopeptide repeat protein n=1 Tax=Brevundimonas sp. TaxID=1871086 RepID=UPI0039E2908D